MLFSKTKESTGQVQLQISYCIFPLQAGISLQADISFFLYCMHKVTSLLHCATKEIRDV